MPRRGGRCLAICAARSSVDCRAFSACAARCHSGAASAALFMRPSRSRTSRDGCLNRSGHPCRAAGGGSSAREMEAMLPAADFLPAEPSVPGLSSCHSDRRRHSILSGDSGGRRKGSNHPGAGVIVRLIHRLSTYWDQGGAGCTMAPLSRHVRPGSRSNQSSRTDALAARRSWDVCFPPAARCQKVRTATRAAGRTRGGLLPPGCVRRGPAPRSFRRRRG